MTRIPLVPMIRRFGMVARSDGVLRATGRASGYAFRRVSGFRPSILSRPQARRQNVPDQYLNGVWQSLARADAFHIPQSPAVNQRRRQIAMIADLNLPQCRKYRVEQLATFWRGRGVEFEFAHYQDIPRAVRIMQHATHLMEYRLQTGPASDMLRYEARRLRLPILYDLDDPLFSVSAYETYRNMEALDPSVKAHFMGEAPKYLNMMNGADVLSVSTPGMQAHAALYTNRPIFVRRNFADRDTLEAGQAVQRDLSADDGIFRVAFASGSQGHEVDLKEILTPLTDFVLEQPNRRLMLIGHFDLSHLPDALEKRVETVKFSSYERYLSALREADCAVMPLCDDTFNRCKSAVRVIDACAVGVPSIVASVGDLPKLVRSGDTGFVASDSESWLEALRAIAADPRGTQDMGRAARRNLECRWKESDQSHIIAPELIDWVEA